MHPLQINFSPIYTAYLTLLAITLLAIVMGLFVVFQAYRGYRRNASQRMLFLAIGFALVTVVPPAVSLVAASVGQRFGFQPVVYAYYLPIVSRLIELFGLGSIIYSLSMQTES